MIPEVYENAKQGWWDGVNIIVKDKSDGLKRIFPHTERNRELFENDHIIHASEISEIAPDVILSVQAMNLLKPMQTVKNIGSIIKKLIKHRRQHKHRFKTMNTYSNGMTVSKYAEFK
jgi:hypothetical protein